MTIFFPWLGIPKLDGSAVMSANTEKPDEPVTGVWYANPDDKMLYVWYEDEWLNTGQDLSFWWDKDIEYVSKMTFAYEKVVFNMYMMNAAGVMDVHSEQEDKETVH